MGKSLVIVESPSKAKIINKYLGNDFVVKASVGHIRDLPAKATAKTASGASGSKTAAKAGTKTTRKKTAAAAGQTKNPLFVRMGLDPEHNWQADYEIMPGKEKVVKELKSLAAKADNIYLATDLDREGEAIAWHLKEVLGGDKPYWRVKYPEITRAAIKKAFEHPSDINMDLVNAQQTRRFLDRVVGFMVSPLLWSKVARGLSAGRVQSVAVELIVDRERAIKAFVPEEYWTVDALTHTGLNEPCQLALQSFNGKKIELKNAAQAQAAVDDLKQQRFVVSKIESRAGSAHAPAPFTTSTLQQTANQRLGFSVRRTMSVAQRLYESGFITYMRTDSVNLSAEALSAAREIIASEFGPEYVPEKPNFYKSKESAQEAHEAIRPSHPEIRANQLPPEVDRDGQRLYALIYARYLACQMTPERYQSNSVTVQAGPYTLKANGRTVLFDGFRRALGGSSDNVLLPALQQGDELFLDSLKPLQHFTQPPARFSEATLVKELEKDGIGRPSTYAAIIETIQTRGYVRLERGRFYAEKMGEIVTDRLRYSFADLMDVSFTAQMENELDEIAHGKLNWTDSLNRFYADFSGHLQKAELPVEQGGMPDNKPIVIDMMCPACGKYHMAVHSGRTGMFLACQGYFDKSVPAKERCQKTLNLQEISDIPAGKGELTQEEEVNTLRERKRCPKCGTAMDAYLVNEHLKLHLCGNSPVCNGYLLEEGDFSNLIEKGPEIICERCGSPMVLKEGRFGKYMACTNSECGNTRKILKSGEVAPPREKAVDLPELPCSDKAPGAHFVLRDGATGIFLAASTFPKQRETRPPLVSELARFRDRISPKFWYLADGPQVDPEGNPFEVRFSRKEKKQYLLSVKTDDKGEKVSGNYTAFYDELTGTWQLHQGKASASTGSKTTRKSSSGSKKSSTTTKKRVSRKKS